VGEVRQVGLAVLTAVGYEVVLGLESVKEGVVQLLALLDNHL
jgi:hypothetical protein